MTTPEIFAQHRAHFLERGPYDAESNLHNIACPTCGNRDRFYISATTTVKLTSCDADSTDLEWDDDSSCLCDRCHFSAILGTDFTWPGLDQLTEQTLADAASAPIENRTY